MQSGAWAALQARAATWSPTTRGLLWAAATGVLFALLNALMRVLTLQLDPLFSQFVRYVFGGLVLLPVILQRGLAHYRPHNLGGQFWRGAVHTVGLMLWFLALPKIPLADMTAISFTGPIFIMIGARLVFKEPMHWERWLAIVLGFAGVLIVVGPRLGGQAGWWHLVMLASAPVFAASFLITKALTRTDSPGVIIVWQAITVSLFSLPLALLNWQWPTPWQWAGFALSGVLGSAGHYCLTRSYVVADISATQSAKFLDLIWAALLGFLLFADIPTLPTIAGGVLISASTIWLARREARRNAADRAEREARESELDPH